MAELNTFDSKQLFEEKILRLPQPPAGESASVPIVLTPRLEWGVQYGFKIDAAEGWARRYRGVQVEFRIDGACYGWYTSPLIPAEHAYP